MEIIVRVDSIFSQFDGIRRIARLHFPNFRGPPKSEKSHFSEIIVYADSTFRVSKPVQ